MSLPLSPFQEVALTLTSAVVVAGVSIVLSELLTTKKLIGDVANAFKYLRPFKGPEHNGPA